MYPAFQTLSLNLQDFQSEDTTESHTFAYSARRAMFELMFGTIDCCSLMVIHKSHCVARLDLNDGIFQDVSQVVTSSLPASLVEVHV